MALADRVTAHAMNREARVLILDIETRPPIVATWRLFNANIGIEQIQDYGGVMGVGYKWLGDRRVTFLSEHDLGHDEMVRRTWDLMSQASVIVGYNSDSFDIKELNSEFDIANLGPVKPFRSIDLIKVNRRNFRHPSRKLDYIVQRLELGAKIKHEGWGMWQECMNGDAKAWARMARYCRMDVHVTEQLYLHWLPWLAGSAHVGVMLGKDRACPNCGGEDLTAAGTTFTALTEYALYRCDNCRTWVRTNYIKARTTLRPVR